MQGGQGTQLVLTHGLNRPQYKPHASGSLLTDRWTCCVSRKDPFWVQS